MAEGAKKVGGGMFVLLGVVLAVIAFGPGMYRDRHPRPQVNVENLSAKALAVIHDGETSGMEPGKTLTIRCEVGKGIEVLVPGDREIRSVVVVIPTAADKQVLNLEANLDRDGVLTARWKEK